jgi:hypothetical protein
MTSVKVAVRCRPFNSREKAANANLIIRMEAGDTWITNPVSCFSNAQKFQAFSQTIEL